MTPLGWSGHVHLSITRRVLDALPMLTGHEKAQILAGEAAPDIEEPWLTHLTKHFQVPGARGQAVDALVEEFNRGTLMDLGRAVHRIEDLVNPYHADRNILLLPEHSSYEAWAERARIADHLEPPHPGRGFFRDGLAPGAWAIAAFSHDALPAFRQAWARRDERTLALGAVEALDAAQDATMELILMWLRQRGRA